LIFACVLAGSLACGKTTGEVTETGSDPDAAEQARADDQTAREELAEPSKAEAREWLRDSSHILFEGSRPRVSGLIDDLYDNGAVKVYFTGIERLFDSDVTATIVVELPDDKSSRQKVFAVEAAFQTEAGEQPAPDVGQKYLRILLD
jgi:hypothetical protein